MVLTGNVQKMRPQFSRSGGGGKLPMVAYCIQPVAASSQRQDYSVYSPRPRPCAC